MSFTEALPSDTCSRKNYKYIPVQSYFLRNVNGVSSCTTEVVPVCYEIIQQNCGSELLQCFMHPYSNIIPQSSFSKILLCWLSRTIQNQIDFSLF